MSTRILTPGAKPRETFALAKDIDPRTGYVPAVASTANVDRYGEIVLPSGLKDYLHVYLKNPILLPAHQHRLPSGEPAVIGLAHNVRINQDDITFDAEFAPASVSALGPKHLEAFRLKFLRAFSIGFLPYEGVYPENEEELLKVCAGLSKGLRDQILALWRGGKGRERPQFVYTKWELLENSPVAVPANREALVAAAAAGLGLAQEYLRGLGDVTAGEAGLPGVRELPDVTCGLAETVSRMSPAAREWVAARVGTPAVLAYAPPSVSTLTPVTATGPTVLPLEGGAVAVVEPGAAVAITPRAVEGEPRSAVVTSPDTPGRMPPMPVAAAGSEAAPGEGKAAACGKCGHAAGQHPCTEPGCDCKAAVPKKDAPAGAAPTDVCATCGRAAAVPVAREAVAVPVLHVAVDVSALAAVAARLETVVGEGRSLLAALETAQKAVAVGEPPKVAPRAATGGVTRSSEEGPARQDAGGDPVERAFDGLAARAAEIAATRLR